jgi:hypothetical protein
MAIDSFFQLFLKIILAANPSRGDVPVAQNAVWFFIA